MQLSGMEVSQKRQIPTVKLTKAQAETIVTSAYIMKDEMPENAVSIAQEPSNETGKALVTHYLQKWAERRLVDVWNMKDHDTCWVHLHGATCWLVRSRH